MIRRRLVWLAGLVWLMFGAAACGTAPVLWGSTATAVPSVGTEPSVSPVPLPPGQGTENARGQGRPGGPPTENRSVQGLPTPSDTQLTPQEIEDLLHMREEEKLARDVYLALYDRWGTSIFQNIARSEQMHMDTMAALLQGYGLQDPVAQTEDQQGVFVDPALQTLYEQLVAQGTRSLADALTVGATIEDLDIKDLTEAIGRTTHADIQAAYENLRNGSYHHIRAFVTNLRAQGVDYTPQYITQEALESILSSRNGGGPGRGRGAGRGHGGG